MTIKYFVYPFAVDGILNAIPDPTQISGVMSYQQGFGPDYALVQTDPAALNVPLDRFNQLMFDITGSIQQVQQNGFPVWITTAMNDGTPFPYTKNSYVRAPDGNVYYSLVDNNTDTPPSPKWQLLGVGGSVSLYFNHAPDTGSANAYVTAPNPPIPAYVAGDVVVLKPSQANTGPSVINVSALGNVPIKTMSNAALVGGELIPSGMFFLIYNAATGAFVVTNPIAIPTPPPPSPAPWVSTVTDAFFFDDFESNPIDPNYWTYTNTGQVGNFLENLSWVNPATNNGATAFLTLKRNITPGFLSSFSFETFCGTPVINPGDPSEFGIGFNPQFPAFAGSGCIQFYFKYGVNGNNWQCVSDSGIINTSIPPKIINTSSIGPWVPMQKLRAEVSSDNTTVEFFIDDVSQGTLPVVQQPTYTFKIRVHNTSAVTAVQMFFDLVAIRQKRIGA